MFNNYGPKPNSELLLGYGFVLPNNPEDTIVLKLGGSEKRHEIGRDAGRWAMADATAAAKAQAASRRPRSQLLSPSGPSALSSTAPAAFSPTSSPSTSPSKSVVSSFDSNKSTSSAATSISTSSSTSEGRVINTRGLSGIHTLWEEVEHMVLSSGPEDADEVLSVTSVEGGWEVTLEVCEALDEMVTSKITSLPDLAILKGAEKGVGRGEKMGTTGAMKRTESSSTVSDAFAPSSSPSKRHHAHHHQHAHHNQDLASATGTSPGSGSGSGSGSDHENNTDREGNATDREIGRNASSDRLYVPRRKITQTKSKRLRDTDVRPEVRAMIYEYVKGTVLMP